MRQRRLGGSRRQGRPRQWRLRLVQWRRSPCSARCRPSQLSTNQLKNRLYRRRSQSARFRADRVHRRQYRRRLQERLWRPVARLSAGCTASNTASSSVSTACITARSTTFRFTTAEELRPHRKPKGRRSATGGDALPAGPAAHRHRRWHRRLGDEGRHQERRQEPPLILASAHRRSLHRQ